MHIIEENTHYAGFWIRFIAYLIDQLILYIAFIVLLTLFTGDPFYQSRIDPFELGRDYWIITSSNLILSVMYYAGMESSPKQATIGKMLMGLKVVGREGQQISLLNAFGRYFAKILSALPLLIGFVMAGFDSKKQALHDKLAETYVVVESRI